MSDQNGLGKFKLLSVTPANEAVRKLNFRLKVFCFVVPAQTGTQGFQSLALGPRFRGGDDLRGLRDLITPSNAGIYG